MSSRRRGIRNLFLPFPVACACASRNSSLHHSDSMYVLFENQKLDLTEINSDVFITARKQSLRRLCFYSCLSVILFTGEGVCVVAGGRAWLQGGMHGCGGACVRYDEIRPMSGRYASYWNAFLFQNLSPVTRIKHFLGFNDSNISH